MHSLDTASNWVGNAEAMSLSWIVALSRDPTAIAILSLGLLFGLLGIINILSLMFCTSLPVAEPKQPLLPPQPKSDDLPDIRPDEEKQLSMLAADKRDRKGSSHSEITALSHSRRPKKVLSLHSFTEAIHGREIIEVPREPDDPRSRCRGRGRVLLQRRRHPLVPCHP